MNNDYYVNKAKGELENRLADAEAKIKAWKKVERFKTREGRDFKNLALNFSKGAILNGRYNTQEKRLYVSGHENNRYFSDELNVYKNIETEAEAEEFKDVIIERGAGLKPFRLATPDEVETLIKGRIEYLEGAARNYRERLAKFDAYAKEALDLRAKIKELEDKAGYIFREVITEGRA